MYYNVPKMITHVKQHKFAVFMFNHYIRDTKSKGSPKPHLKLFNEILLTSNPEGGSVLVDFKNDIHNIAIYNRTRARFTW